MPDLEIYDRLGRVEAQLEGLRALVKSENHAMREYLRDFVVSRIDEHLRKDDDVHKDHETRLRSVEDHRSETKGQKAASARYAALVSGIVSVSVSVAGLLFHK